MNRMFKGFGSLAAVVALSASGLGGCGVQDGNNDAELGSISLPLAAEAPSGARYRLRNATFRIQNSYYYWDDNTGVAAVAGGGYAGGTDVTINSEDEDPDAASILVDLEQGQYTVTLLPGWNFEKVEGTTVTDVEATLLSSQSVYVYVYPHSTTWAQYQFGIGDRAMWLNGQLNVNIEVYEDPSEYYYGQGGAGGGSTVVTGTGSAGGGDWGSGGWSSAGAGGAGGAGGGGG